MELLTLACEKCGVEEAAPTSGWLKVAPARKSEPNTEPVVAKGDFCSLECLTAFLETLSVPPRLIPDSEAPRVSKSRRGKIEASISLIDLPPERAPERAAGEPVPAGARRGRGRRKAGAD